MGAGEVASCRVGGGGNVCTGIEQLRRCTWVERDYTEGWAEVVRGCKERVNGQDTE